MDVVISGREASTGASLLLCSEMYRASAVSMCCWGMLGGREGNAGGAGGGGLFRSK